MGVTVDVPCTIDSGYRNSSDSPDREFTYTSGTQMTQAQEPRSSPEGTTRPTQAPGQNPFPEDRQSRGAESGSPESGVAPQKEFLTQLPFHVDVAAVQAVVRERYSLFGDDSVLCVNSHPRSKNPLKDFAAWLPDDISEDDFTIVNEAFRGTAIEELLHQLPFPYRRARLMRMPPKSCLTIHWDACLRYHYAIQTNPACFLVHITGNTADLHHVPADGHLYEMDGTQIHTAMNASKAERIHLVLSSLKFDDVREGRPASLFSDPKTAT